MGSAHIVVLTWPRLNTGVFFVSRSQRVFTEHLPCWISMAMRPHVMRPHQHPRPLAEQPGSFRALCSRPDRSGTLLTNRASVRDLVKQTIDEENTWLKNDGSAIKVELHAAF